MTIEKNWFLDISDIEDDDSRISLSIFSWLNH